MIYKPFIHYFSMERAVDKIISFFFELAFSKEKKIQRWLVVLIIIGFILRLIAALNLGVFPDDIVHGSQSAGIISAGLLSTHSTPPLFFYLNDISFYIFGYSTFALRFSVLIFGTLLIPLIFLITLRFFNEKVALASAFVVTFSNLLVRMTISEQSLIVLFFSFFAVYLGMEYFDRRKLSLLIFSATLFGMAMLTKYSAPFFIFAFLVYSTYYLKSKKEKIVTKRNIKHLGLFLIIILIFSIPFLSFNYFIYKDKGIVDIYFSRIVQLNSTQQLYGGLLGQEDTLFDNMKKLNFYGNIFLIYHLSIILLILTLFGLFLMFKYKQKVPLVFFLVFFFVLFFLQSVSSPLTKHFVFMPFLVSIPAGFALSKILEKINNKTVSIILIIILILFFIVGLGNRYGTPTNYFSQSDFSQVKSFLHNNVQSGDLIVVDSRIYTAQAFWYATPDYLLNMHAFINFYRYNQNLSNEYKIPVRVYVVECVADQCGCGWGSDPELNQSTEAILSGITYASNLIKTISSYDYSGNELIEDKEETEKYAIYTLTLDLNPQLLAQTDLMNSFYFAPYMYKNMNDYIFNYNLYSDFDNLLSRFAYLIIIVSMILSFLSIIFVLYYSFKGANSHKMI